LADELQTSGRFDAARLGRESRRRLAKAGAADGHSAALIGAGSAAVTVGGIFMAVTTLEPSKTPKSVWVNAWFDVGFGFLVAGLIIVAFGLYLNFGKREPESKEEAEAQSVSAAGGPGVQPQEPLLSVRILSDSQFEGRGPSAMIAAVHISVDNITDRKIRVVGCEFSYDNEGRLSWEQYVTDEQRKDFRDELERREEMQMYGPSLQLPAWIDAHSRISGWIMKSVTRNLAGGTPACTVFIVDDLGNSYEARLPGHEPGTYPAKS
jgi:hypothetical protein